MAGILGDTEKKKPTKPRHYLKIAREISWVADRMDNLSMKSDDTEAYERLRKRLEELKAEYDDSYDYYHNPKRQKEYEKSRPWYERLLHIIWK